MEAKMLAQSYDSGRSKNVILYADDGPESQYIEGRLKEMAIPYTRVPVPSDFAGHMPELWVNGYKLNGRAAISTHFLRPSESR